MNNCSINNIVGCSCTPVFVELTIGGSLEINGCEFINCSVRIRCGGTLRASFKNGSLIIGKSGDKKQFLKIVVLILILFIFI